MTSRYLHAVLAAGPRHARKLLLAAALVACEPFNPYYGDCDYDPPCETWSYDLRLTEANFPEPGLARDSTSGIWNVDNAGFWIRLSSSYPAVAAKPSSGGGGRAYALSCAPCDAFVTADSLYFTTDLVTVNGDTLESGYNFIGNTVPLGFASFGGTPFRVDSLTGFRDSLFEVRFRGTIEDVPVTASATLRITNPALLLP